MTTIAYRNGVMAGDTRLTVGDTVLPDTCTKVFRLPDGSLFGASGDAEGGEVLMAALRKGAKKMPRLKSTLGLWAKTDGTLWYYEGRMWALVEADYAAIGNGAPYAIAVMQYDPKASAKAAVKTACKLDIYSGEPIVTVRMKRKRK